MYYIGGVHLAKSVHGSIAVSGSLNKWWVNVGDIYNSIANWVITPWKINMSPENQWLEDVFPIEIVPFWGTC